MAELAPGQGNQLGGDGLWEVMSVTTEEVEATGPERPLEVGEMMCARQQIGESGGRVYRLCRPLRDRGRQMNHQPVRIRDEYLDD